jgi:serine/threonine protein kinase
MSDLQHILEQFRQGLLGFEQLQEAVDRLAEGGTEVRQSLSDILSAEFSAGRLPPQVYVRLDARLQAELDADAPARLAKPMPADPRPMPPADGGDADSTRLAVANFPEPESGRTIPAAPRPGITDDETRLSGAEEATLVVAAPASRPYPPDAALRVSPAPAALNASMEDARTLLVASPAAGPGQELRMFEPADPTEVMAERASATHSATRTLMHRMPFADRPLQIGMVLKDRFVLEEVIGGGGMGTVFKALDLRKSEAKDKEPYVAIKVLNPEFRDNPISLIALQRETKRAQTLSHPNIIKVFDFDRDGNHVFMSMEYLRGQPLSQTIKELLDTGMPFKKAWPIIRAMAEALGSAHRKDIVHSDFKPGNVFLDEHGEVRVLDFGIACAAGRAEKNADATVFNARDLGALTPAYASLEMLENKDPDPSDDIYALGCVVYELLAGKHPYGKLQADKALELNLQPKPVPGLNRKQWRGLQRALALKREHRTPSAELFIKDMQRRSAMFYTLWALVLTASATTGASLYLGFSAPKEPPKVLVQLSAEQQKQIKDLLELAAIHFEVGYLTAPTGSNALWAYQEVLKIDPYREDAAKGLRRIADALEQAAWAAFERGDKSGSLKKAMEGLEAVPNHAGLLALRRKLER